MSSIKKGTDEDKKDMEYIMEKIWNACKNNLVDELKELLLKHPKELEINKRVSINFLD